MALKSRHAGISVIDPPEYGYFSRVTYVGDIPIKAHADVCDEAMLEAARRIGRLLERLPVVHDNLARRGAEHHIIPVAQQCSDLPEWRHMKGRTARDRTDSFDMDFDERVRGMGGLFSSCGEDNLLRLPDERYKDHRDICSHEFTHCIHGYGLSQNVKDLIVQKHRAAVGKGLWPSYAGTNEWEYLAELSMWYFGNNGDPGNIKPEPRPGPEWLREYDPKGYAFLDDFWNGRIPVEPVEFVSLEPLNEPPRPAVPDGASSISFFNRASGAVGIYRVSADGRTTFETDLPHGHEREFLSFCGETWLVRLPGEREAFYTTSSNPCVAVLRDM
jgi:hypothetical protein